MKSIYKVGEIALHEGRKVKILDYKWNLVLIRYEDETYEQNWIDVRTLRKCS